MIEQITFICNKVVKHPNHFLIVGNLIPHKKFQFKIPNPPIAFWLFAPGFVFKIFFNPDKSQNGFLEITGKHSYRDLNALREKTRLMTPDECDLIAYTPFGVEWFLNQKYRDPDASAKNKQKFFKRKNNENGGQ